VHEEAANGWNVTASARYARLFKAATVSADRLLRRGGHRGRMPRRVAVVWSEQARGVWHVHEALPAGSELERAWSRQVVRFMDQATKREARMTFEERRALLDLERVLEQPTRGFYGWGFVDRNPLRRAGRSSVTERHASAARYLARNVAGYLVENVQAESGKPSEDEGTIAFQGRRMVRRGTGELIDDKAPPAARAGAWSPGRLPGRALRGYVSVRLTMRTGVTMRNLRRARYLWVCLRHGLELPAWPEAELAQVGELMVGAGVGAARGP
jgi:hypothetical protein